MRFGYSPYALPLLAAAAMALALAAYALRRRQHPEARIFALLTAALAWWSLCYALSIAGVDLETQYLWNRLKYIGVLPVPPLWTWLAMQYTQQPAAPTVGRVAPLFLPAALMLPLVLTDHLLHLWWPQVWAGQFGGQLALEHSHGLLYYLQVGVSYVLVLWGLWLYLRFYRHTELVYRSQATLLIIAGLVPLVASVLTQLGLSPMPWGLDSFFFTLSALLIAFAIFRYRFLDLVPVARRAIVEQLPDGVLVIDAAGRLVDANPAALQLMGSERASPIGKPLAEAVQIPAVRQTLLDLLQAQPVPDRERDVELSGRVLSARVTDLTPAKRSGRGQPLGRIILLRDISDRVAAQQKLAQLYREAELERRRLALTIQAASDPMALLEASGKVLAWNQAARQILHGERVDAFPEPVRQVLARARGRSDPTAAEIELLDAHFQVTIAPIAHTGLVLTMHDITHFKHLARLKDEFVSTVSHDLRAPLTSIVGYAQLARMPAASREMREDAAARIESSAQRMNELINDMLDLAKIEAGIEDEREPVRLDLLARLATEDLAGAAVAKGIAIELDLQPHPPVSADGRLMMAVWSNLISNAIKYTGQGQVTIRVRAENGQVRAEVADTGLGIPPADLPYIFDKFFRAKLPYTRGTTGTGLGLALVKSIVERHGGQVGVTSQPGKGSTFSFTLPLPGNPSQESDV